MDKPSKTDFDIKGVFFKNFVNLTESEKIEVLDWRNHENVRSVMLTKEIIPLHNHIQFLQKLASSPDKAYWMASYRDMKLGVVDLYDITDSKAYWGYYLNNQYLGSSYGILLEYMILEIAFNVFNLSELWCESLTMNKGVIKTHKTFGYTVVEEKNDCTIQMINAETFAKNKLFYESITRKFWE